MFCKLPLIFNKTDANWHQFKSDTCVAKFYSQSRSGGGYFYTIKNRNLFNLLLKSEIFGIPPDAIAYCEFTGPGLVKPHKDDGMSVALNFYIETDNAVTIFYKESTDIIDNNKLYYSEINDSLVETGRFHADQYDCYLLDVSSIHGIQKCSDKIRTMISLRWRKHSYKDILNSLNFN